MRIEPITPVGKVISSTGNVTVLRKGWLNPRLVSAGYLFLADDSITVPSGGHAQWVCLPDLTQVDWPAGTYSVQCQGFPAALPTLPRLAPIPLDVVNGNQIHRAKGAVSYRWIATVLTTRPVLWKTPINVVGKAPYLSTPLLGQRAKQARNALIDKAKVSDDTRRLLKADISAMCHLFAEARHHLQEFTEAKNSQLVQLMLGDLYLADKTDRESIAAYQSAKQIAKSASDTLVEALACQALGLVYAFERRSTEAANHLVRARDLFTACREPEAATHTARALESVRNVAKSNSQR